MFYLRMSLLPFIYLLFISLLSIPLSFHNSQYRTTDQYRYEMLRKFGSQLNIKNQLNEFPTVGQNKTKCKLNLEIKGKTISIVGVLFLSGVSPIVVAM